MPASLFRPESECFHSCWPQPSDSCSHAAYLAWLRRPQVVRRRACLSAAIAPEDSFWRGSLDGHGRLAQRSAPERVRSGAPTAPATGSGSAYAQVGADGLRDRLVPGHPWPTPIVVPVETRASWLLGVWRPMLASW